MLVKDGRGLIFMHKKILLICLTLLIVLILIFITFFKENKNEIITTSSHKSKVSDPDIALKNDFKVSQSKGLLENNKSPYKSEISTSFMDEKKFNEILENGKENGVIYIPVNSLDPKDRKDAEDAIENLMKTGSLSGGIRLKEFTELDKARDILEQEGLNNILARLDDFKSAPDSIFEEYDMKVTGAQNFGLYHEEKGWSGIYKLYENSNEKVEIQQINLKPDESSQLLVAESLNILLSNQTPAIYEYIRNENIEKLTFVSDKNYYQINSSNLNKDQIIDIANKVILNPSK